MLPKFWPTYFHVSEKNKNIKKDKNPKISWYKGKIEQIESLTINWGLNRAHQKPRTKNKSSHEAKVEIEFLMGFNCMKSSLNFLGAIIEFLKDQIIFLPS